MNWISRSALVITLIASPALAGEGPFISISIADACAKAKSEDKLVFVDFYTSWCAPCKVMDKTTLADEEVIKWLNENTVALKIDAEKEIKLAKKYRIDSYPTFLFAKPDGEVAGLLFGAHAIKEFLDEAKAIKAGKSPMVRAKEKLISDDENNPHARIDYARSLMRMGKYKEALSAFLWCYDHGNKHSVGFVGVRNSYLITDIVRLGRKYPSALEELRKRRDAARERVITEAPEKPSLWRMFDAANADYPAMDVAALNRELGEEGKTLELYDKMRKEHSDWPAVEQLRRSAFEPLLRKRRYAEIAESTDIEAAVKARIDRQKSMRKHLPKDRLAKFEEMDRRFLIDEIVKYYEVLLGVQDAEAAARLASKTLEIDDSQRTYNLLAWHGYLSGHSVPANVEQARRAFELSNESSAAILDTLVRVLHAQDKSREACELLNAKKNAFEKKQHRAIIKDCIEELGCS